MKTLSLFADECIPRRAWKSFVELVQHQRTAEIFAAHLYDEGWSGVSDDKLVTRLAEDKASWIVISADTGRKSKRTDPRLPALLPQAGVTGIFLSKAFAQRSGFGKVQPLVTCFAVIIDVADAKPGTRLKIEPVRYGFRCSEW